MKTFPTRVGDDEQVSTSVYKAPRDLSLITFAHSVQQRTHLLLQQHPPSSTVSHTFLQQTLGRKKNLQKCLAGLSTSSWSSLEWLLSLARHGVSTSSSLGTLGLSTYFEDEQVWVGEGKGGISKDLDVECFIYLL